MKKTQVLFACALVLAVAGIASLHAADEGRKEAKATIRKVHGKVEYLDNGNWVLVKPNMQFSAGTSIRTGPDGVLDMSVNGVASAVHIEGSTTMQIQIMSYVGTRSEGDTTTLLKLQEGGVLGIIKKLSANSTYEVMTPRGVAGIRGTMCHWQVQKIDPQHTQDTFDCVDGHMTVAPFHHDNGQPKLYDLNSKNSVILADKVTLQGMDAAQVQTYQSMAAGLNQSVDIATHTGTPAGTPAPGTGTPTTQPFTAGQPQGDPAS
jgi:hypothetical protein